MTEMAKSGKLKLTIELEANEELMNIVKEGLTKVPEMMKKGGEVKQ